MTTKHQFHIKHQTVLFAISGLLLLTTLLAGLILANSSSRATDNAKHGSAVAVSVNSSCTLKGGSDGTSTTDSVYSATMNAGTTEEITGSKLTAVCNDPNGYSLYAIGYSGDSYTPPTNTQMIGASGNINTGTSGTAASWWAMKINPVSGNNPTIMNNFNTGKMQTLST